MSVFRKILRTYYIDEPYFLLDILRLDIVIFTSDISYFVTLARILLCKLENRLKENVRSIGKTNIRKHGFVKLTGTLLTLFQLSFHLKLR